MRDLLQGCRVSPNNLSELVHFRPTLSTYLVDNNDIYYQTVVVRPASLKNYLYISTCDNPVLFYTLVVLRKYLNDSSNQGHGNAVEGTTAKNGILA